MHLQCDPPFLLINLLSHLLLIRTLLGSMSSPTSSSYLILLKKISISSLGCSFINSTTYKNCSCGNPMITIWYIQTSFPHDSSLIISLKPNTIKHLLILWKYLQHIYLDSPISIISDNANDILDFANFKHVIFQQFISWKLNEDTTSSPSPPFSLFIHHPVEPLSLLLPFLLIS